MGDDAEKDNDLMNDGQFIADDVNGASGNSGGSNVTLGQLEQSMLNDDVFTRRLIEAVRCQPCLYDPSHEHYGHRHSSAQYRSEVWSNICQQLRYDGDPQSLQSYWKRIRDRYVRERRKRRLAGYPDPIADDKSPIVAGSAAGRHFNVMKWIDAYIETRSEHPSSSTPYAMSDQQQGTMAGFQQAPGVRPTAVQTSYANCANMSSAGHEGCYVVQSAPPLPGRSGQRILYRVVEPDTPLRELVQTPQRMVLPLTGNRKRPLPPIFSHSTVSGSGLPCVYSTTSGFHPQQEIIEDGTVATGRVLTTATPARIGLTTAPASSSSAHRKSQQFNNRLRPLQTRIPEIRPRPTPMASSSSSPARMGKTSTRGEVSAIPSLPPQYQQQQQHLQPQQNYTISGGSQVSSHHPIQLPPARAVYDPDPALVNMIVKHLAKLNEDEVMDSRFGHGACLRMVGCGMFNAKLTVIHLYMQFYSFKFQEEERSQMVDQQSSGPPRLQPQQPIPPNRR